MSDLQPVKIDIRQGGVICNEGWIVAPGVTVVAITVDLKTKRAEISGLSSDSDGTPGVYLSVGEGTLHYDAAKRDDLTEITFPEFRGWHVHAAHASRYTLAVCLVKDGAE